jgi:hypothetical protein
MRELHFYHPLEHKREASKNEAVVSGEAKVVIQTMLATSVAFVDALSAFLSIFYSEFTNNEKETTEAWSFVCSIDWLIFEDIAIHRCLARFADFKGGANEQVATK